jgi:hypothetical protein
VRLTRQSQKLTRSADIKLNTRLRLPPAVAIVSSPQLRGVPTAIQPNPRNQGSPLTQRGGGPAHRGLDRKLNDTPTQLDPLDRDGWMLDSLARNSFEFCFCRL